MLQQNSNNNLHPSMPYFLSSYNHRYTDPGFMNCANYLYYLIESIKKAIKRRSPIFRVEKLDFYNYNYRIRCDSSLDALARTLDGTFNVFNLGSFEPYKANPIIEQIKDVQLQTPSTLYSLNFAMDHSVSANMLYSAHLDKYTAEHQCDLLNKKIALLRYQCKHSGVEKQCTAYEAPAKMNMKLVKQQLTNLYNNYFQVYQVELLLLINPNKKYDLDWIMTTDQVGQFIKQLQSTPLYDAINSYFWRLDYDQNMGYFYVFDCSFDRQYRSKSPEGELTRIWSELSGGGCCCVNDEQFYFSQFLRSFNMFEMLNSSIEQELSNYLIAPIELGKYLHIDTSKYKQATFGTKETDEKKKKKNGTRAGNKLLKGLITLES